MTAVAETLGAISTPETLNLFKVIAVTNKGNDNNASRRIAKLTKAGLVMRNGREYFPTSYGKIGYHNLL
jgi:hypothetical protein